ncbi:DEAD-domain-containing protein [Aaosphaeria arxii CBS 175.79]|uniref:ATP-dependent RNA helicase n=1 Tax=Aaosphaeria arxii CBS 175.79 TaxID=1450172 RepID=A0A6A5X8Z4_9PLEO|nr:DEAD-domain-containing protein [Aaosphaeria arxii CBS 175.79]KAF2009438.1 DEAD-domain-containing protein [Aaosphaeria arxii CBS 175.79]
MAESTAKRPNPSKSNNNKSRKRQRVEKSSQTGRSNASKEPAKRQKVRLNELAWKDVDMPDRLDDFEGFYGLEEIDDVDVVRDETTGVISFESSESKLAKDVPEPTGDAEEVGQDEDDGDDDEAGSWGGFSDAEENGHDTDNAGEVVDNELSEAIDSVPQAKAKEGKKDADGAKGKTKKNKKEQKKLQEAELATNGPSAFEILAEQADDDEEDEGVDVSAWEELDLSTETLGALSKLKFTRPTAIQSSAIPEILAGHDVIGKASTGSGKTLAFGIPILESYLASRDEVKKNKAPLAMIISPTRELAHQISAHLTALCTGKTFDAPYIATITGGLSVQKQRRQLETADIIVGTPGRLWEVISSGHGVLDSFKKIKFLVVDEADRLLSQGHYKELGEIINVLEKDDDFDPEDEVDDSKPVIEVNRQTLVFSATFHKGLQQKLAGKGPKGGELMNKQESMEYLLKKLHFREEKPKFIDANPTAQMASGLKEGLVECAGTEKDLFLYSVLMFHPKKRALIFTNSIAAVRRLTPFLQNLDLPALALHSGMLQKARLRSVERFKSRAGSILVATDVAARGLDIPGVELIVHYHLPRAADTYVHRSGRTARAEASGSSILICAPEEVAGVRRLVAKVHAKTQPSKSKKTAFFIRTLDIDRRIVSRLKPRATLAKKLADAVIAKEKKHSENDWMRAAAEDLGVEYDSETFEAEAKGKRGRGAGRKKKEKEAQGMTKAEMQGLRAELKSLLAQRINTGVSERYLTSGGIDVEKLLQGSGNLGFLGDIGGLGMDDEE